MGQNKPRLFYKLNGSLRILMCNWAIHNYKLSPNLQDNNESPDVLISRIISHFSKKSHVFLGKFTFFRKLRIIPSNFDYVFRKVNRGVTERILYIKEKDKICCAVLLDPVPHTRISYKVSLECSLYIYSAPQRSRTNFLEENSRN